MKIKRKIQTENQWIRKLEAHLDLSRFLFLLFVCFCYCYCCCCFCWLLLLSYCLRWTIVAAVHCSATQFQFADSDTFIKHAKTNFQCIFCSRQHKTMPKQWKFGKQTLKLVASHSNRIRFCRCWYGAYWMCIACVCVSSACVIVGECIRIVPNRCLTCIFPRKWTKRTFDWSVMILFYVNWLQWQCNVYVQEFPFILIISFSAFLFIH